MILRHLQERRNMLHSEIAHVIRHYDFGVDEAEFVVPRVFVS